MSGMQLARFLVALVYGGRMLLAVYWMLTHEGGGFGQGGIITVGVGVFILWGPLRSCRVGALFRQAADARLTSGRGW